MIERVHSLWDSKLWTSANSLPRELESILDITPIEKSIILGASSTEAAEEEHNRTKSPASTVDQFIHQIRNWLRMYRENLYAIIAQASYLVPGDFFFNPTLAPSLLNHLFGSVTSITNHHWRSLLIVIRPLIINCPAQHFQSVLGQVVPPLATYLGNKLNEEWKRAVDAGVVMGTIEEAEMALGSSESMEDKGGKGVSNEVLEHKILRDVTRGWTDILAAIFMPTCKYI
jgi:exportin-5